MKKEIQSLLMNNTTQESIKIIERLLEDEGRTIYLKCIDTNNYVKGDHFHIHKNEVNTQDFKHRISTNKLTVDHINNHNDYVLAYDENEIKYYIPFNKLKYFRLKLKLNKVDVQNQLLKELLTAINKNKSINIIYMDDDIIKFKYNKHSIIEYNINDLLYEDDLNDAIEMIKSVYKPFIIKSKDDIAKLNCFCYGILTNGSRFEIIDEENTNENNRIWVWVSFTSEDSKPILLNFDTLLGAKIYPFKLSSDRIEKTRNNK